MSNLSTSYSAPQIIDSKNFIDDLSRELKPGKILVVTSNGFSKRGLVTEVLRVLGTDRVLVFDKVQPNPEKKDLADCSEEFKGQDIRTVVALGGGSVMDSAKVFCALLSHQHKSLTELLATANVANQLAFIAMPTTSGTGSEVTPFATVWESETNSKFSLNGITPDIAILDPSLTLTLPYRETLYPALDTLSHALESLWNIHKTHDTIQYAIKAIEQVCSSLPQVLTKPDDLAARRELQKAATLAGLAIAHTKTALAHAISYPLTAMYGVPHGLACSFTLQAILDEVGQEQLGLPQSNYQKIAELLNHVDFSKELAPYVKLKKIQQLATLNFDKSRTENFVLPVTPELVARVLQSSQGLPERGASV